MDKPKRFPAATHSTTVPAGLNDSDEALAARVARGDQEALGLLVTRHDADLRRLCAALMRDDEAGADVAQEAWLRAWSALARAPQPPHRFHPWLRTLARNLCFDALRRGGRTQAAELDHLVTGAAGPEEALVAREEARLVLGDLSGLPERQRAAMAGSLAGLSPAEVAREMGVTERQAGTLLAEGRRSLTHSRAGRELSCHEVRRAMESRRGRNRMVRAHIDCCAACRTYQRRVRSRALLTLPLPPWLWPWGERLASPLAAELGPAAGSGALSTVAAVAVAFALVGAGADIGEVPPSPEPRGVEGTAPHGGPFARPEPDRATERRDTPRRSAPRPETSASARSPERGAPPAPPTPQREESRPVTPAPAPAPNPGDGRRQAVSPPSPPAPGTPAKPAPATPPLVAPAAVRVPAVVDLPPVAAAPLAPLDPR